MLAIVAVPSAASAQDKASPPWAGKDGLEFALGAFMFRPKLANVSFDHGDFHHRGREIGLDTPSMWGVDLGFHLRHQWITFGLVGFFGGHPGGRDAAPDPPNTDAPQIANTGSIVTFGVASDLAAVIPAGRHVSLRFGPLAGIRAFVLPLSGAPKESCSSDEGGCTPTAISDVQPFFQPRVRALVSLDNTALFFGASLGYEIFGGGVAAGAFIGGAGDL